MQHTLNTSSVLIRVLRGTRIFLHVLLGLMITSFYFPFCSRSQRNFWIVWWSQQLLGILNIQLRVEGDLPKPQSAGYMLVSNHISWLDIHLIHAVCPARFIAKSEIRRWPIFGWLASQTGTLFLRRNSNSSAASMVKQAVSSLRQGDLLCCFPEGTTSDGKSLLPFHGSLLQAAIEAEVEIIPMVITYRDDQGLLEERIAFIGEMTLMQSILNIISIQQTQATLHFLPAIPSLGHHRRGLTISAQHAIAHQLNTPH